jgi:tetratricopeptide (TPR) repeat protein
MRTVPIALAVAMLLPAAPASADQRAAARHAELDRMYKALLAAPDEQAAMLLEGHIRALWVQAASPAATLLLARGDRELQSNDGDEALADYDAVLALEPDFSEGYNHRARARDSQGDYAGAVRDIEEALKRDPRNFSALQGLSHIAEQQHNYKGALAAWQKSLDIDPRTPGGLERLDMLQKKVDGEAT